VGIIGKDKHNTRQKTEEMSNPNPTTNPEGTQVFTKCKKLFSFLHSFIAGRPCIQQVSIFSYY
jgi:hypothetical protein